jgi:hypothetical protein
MNLEQRFCPNPLCTDEAWMVQRDPTTRDVWWVAAHAADRPFTLAATVPVCPRCGTTLLVGVELEGRRERRLASPVEAPVFSLKAA